MIPVVFSLFFYWYHSRRNGPKSKFAASLLEEALKKLPTFETPAKPTIAPSLQAVIQEAQTIASDWKDTYIASDHLMLAYWKLGKEPIAGLKKTISLGEVERKIKDDQKRGVLSGRQPDAKIYSSRQTREA